MFRTILVGLSLTCAISLRAEILSFSFSGTITDADVAESSLDDSITNGAAFSGFYTFDSETPDSEPDVTVGDYYHTNSAFGVAVKVGNYVFRTNPSKVDFIIETTDRPNSDNYLFRSYLNVASSGDSMGDIEFQTYDDSGTAYTNDFLPIVPPNLSAFPNGHHLGIHGANFSLYGPVESISINSATITNPPAATLFPAVEVTWPSMMGNFYQVQESPDLSTWTNRGKPILGVGDPISIFVRQEGQSKYFRLVIQNNGG